MSGPEDRLCSLTPDCSGYDSRCAQAVRISILDSERMIGASRLFIMPFPILPHFPIRKISRDFLPGLIYLLVSISAR